MDVSQNKAVNFRWDSRATEKTKGKLRCTFIMHCRYSCIRELGRILTDFLGLTSTETQLQVNDIRSVKMRVSGYLCIHVINHFDLFQ